ncbi:protein kinase [Streptosporangium sp. NPDC051023]|uniref:protein kinase domain-containing protein n=1 Tax=Streptosporangium sp. NPDC051023 TaxID=3155410 RepID=UPI003450DA6C
MPHTAPPAPDDPQEVAGYRVVGRLGDSQPADGYLAVGPSSTQAIIRFLSPGANPERFLRAIEPLRGVAAFSVAQVLDGGLHEGRPYIMTEYVEGETLAEAVAESGPLRDAALDRFAIGTMAALAAIHRAGVVHGDVRPETIVLGPDGPIVVDFGLAQALGTVEDGPTRSVGVPAHQAPELLGGSAPSAPADVFAWASTVVFAATGVSPFAAETMASTINRLLHDEPDLTAIPGELGTVLAECLAKEPDARPAANIVLLRLIGESSLLEAATAIATGQVAETPAPARPSRRRTGRVVLLGTAFLAVAALSGAVVYLALPRAATTVARPSSPVSASVAPRPATTAKPTAAPWQKVEKASTTIKLEGTSITVHEHPSDPVKISAYLKVKSPFTAYLRDKSGKFRQVGQTEEPSLSPNGTWLAMVPWIKFLDSDYDRVTLRDSAAGTEFTVSTVKQPLQSISPVWSRDGSRLLLSVRDPEKKIITGFVLVDPVARTASYVEAEYTGSEDLVFGFTPDGRIARGFTDGKRVGIDFYDTTGRVIRSMPWVGRPRDRSWFSPSGAVFATVCPKDDESLCVWDAATGNRRTTVPIPPQARWFGWFNDDNVLIQVPHKKEFRIQVMDFAGTVRRVLADVPDQKEAFLRFAGTPR